MHMFDRGDNAEDVPENYEFSEIRRLACSGQGDDDTNVRT